MVLILSLNTRGLVNDKKRRIIFKMCRDRADIVFLQETHSVVGNEQIWSSEWGNKIIFSHGNSESRGVCIMYKKGLDIHIKQQFLDPNGRYIVLSC